MTDNEQKYLLDALAMVLPRCSDPLLLEPMLLSLLHVSAVEELAQCFAFLLQTENDTNRSLKRARSEHTDNSQSHSRLHAKLLSTLQAVTFPCSQKDVNVICVIARALAQATHTCAAEISFAIVRAFGSLQHSDAASRNALMQTTIAMQEFCCTLYELRQYLMSQLPSHCNWYLQKHSIQLLLHYESMRLQSIH